MLKQNKVKDFVQNPFWWTGILSLSRYGEMNTYMIKKGMQNYRDEGFVQGGGSS